MDGVKRYTEVGQAKKFQLSTVCAEKIFNGILAPLIEEKKHKVIVIGIDGPTAVGKTILADTLAEKVRTAYKRACWIYRLDWSLAQREKRAQDLKNLVKKNVSFHLEGELHMRLGAVTDFLKAVRIYNENIDDDIQHNSKIISLENLYSRKDNGNLTGKQECPLEPGLVIFIEGHYTLRTELDNLIDYNILMLGDKSELLARKTVRVEGYRKAIDAEDYFWRVDLPSFHHHLKRFGLNADLVIDNTVYQNPEIKKLDFINEWLMHNESMINGSKEKGDFISLSDLADRVLSFSLMVGDDFKSAFRAVLGSIIEWDCRIGQYLRLSIDHIDGDLTSLSNDLISSLNKQFLEKPHSFVIRHTNALYNVYNRSLPITIGVGIQGEQPVNILADTFHDFLRIQVSWAGGYYCFHIERKLGKISGKNEYTFIRDMASDKINIFSSDTTVRVITPTLFTIPRFLSDFKIEEVFSGREQENISASQALVELADKGGVWIHRFAKFSEINFFSDFILNTGGNTVKAGNYLIATWSQNDALMRKFKLFRDEWSKKIYDLSSSVEDEDKLDEIIDHEWEELRLFVKNNCPDFVVLDGYLQCSKVTHDALAWRRIVDQIAAMLGSDSRLVRKRTTQFIERYFPGLSLQVSQLWDDVPLGAREHISLNALTLISPSILAELYLWLALREDHSAVLGANIYDIRKNSVDCRAYLKAVASRQTAIVFQGSLNALGQKEQGDGFTMQGYLKPKQGAQDLVEAVLLAARDMVLVSGKIPPLFSIGLDHVDINGDRPKGRAKRFLQEAMSSEQVTHYVLDGSALFSAKNNAQTELEKSFQEIIGFAVDLLGNKINSYIYDMEICCTELDYIDNMKKTFIPTPKIMELFVKVFKKKMRESGFGAHNTRPTLFIANLGTTHHGSDRGMVAVENSRLWRDRLKKDNFVSAVLHGTTGTHPHLLLKATVGCHKINVAGDFLYTLINALPQRLQSVVCSGDSGPKRKIFEIRKDMDAMSSMEVINLEESLRAYCRNVLDNINAPKLDSLDIEYFRYKNYKFSKKQIDSICAEILGHIEGYLSLNSEKPLDVNLGYRFFASMVEVPFDEGYKHVTQALWEEGVRDFHVDAGDGRFVPREFSGLEKAEYLRKAFPEAVIHCHLMIENPHFATDNGLSSIERYIAAGCNAIAVHRKAFSEEKLFLSALKLIRKLGARPGVVIETSETLDMDLENLISGFGLDWVIVMGVPVGYGGQIFDMSTLKRISWFYQLAAANNKPLLIEADGGLTLDNLSLCKKAGAQVFAGWTIVKDSTIEGIRKKVRQVHKLISR